MSFVRMIEVCRPARQAAAYHIVVPAGGASLEIRLDTDRDPLRADSVTALLIGPAALDRLSERKPSGDPVLVVSVPHERASTWPTVAINGADMRSRSAGRTIVMSPAALLLAERIRYRCRRMGQSGRGHSCYAVAAEDRACVNALLDALLRDLSVDSKSTDVRRSTSHAPLVNRARRLLSARPASPHRLTELADSLGVSPFHFARVFRAETGLSVHQYLLRLRMAGALARLSCSETELSRLALDLGFSSHSHFTTTFRKQFGESPARVRMALERDRRPATTRPARFAEVGHPAEAPVWNPYARLAAVIRQAASS